MQDVDVMEQERLEDARAVYLFEDNEGELCAVLGDVDAWQEGKPYVGVYYLDAVDDALVGHLRIIMQDPQDAVHHVAWDGDWVSLEIFDDVDDQVEFIRAKHRLVASVIDGVFAWLARPQNPKARRLYDPDWE